MLRRAVLLVALAVISGGSRRASAEDVVGYEAEGDAAASGVDPRIAALDDAFAHAITSALGELITGDVRTAHKGELDREIVGHARLWIVKFTVTRDEVNDDRRQLAVSVRVDRDKLRARLEELKIPVREDGGLATVPVGSGTPGPVPAVTILLRIAGPTGTRADFGPGADHDVPGLAALTGALRGAGMAVRRAPASGAAPTDAELPIDDGPAETLADAAKADLVAIAGVTVGAPRWVRGQAAPASLVTARIRLIDRRDHKVVGQGSAVAIAHAAQAGAPQDDAYAIDHALLAAIVDVLPPAPKKLAQAGAFRGEDTPVAEPGVVLVRLPGRTPYGMVTTEQRYLAGARGVRAATLRRVSPAGWVIGVVTAESIEKVAQIAKHAPATDTAAAVKISHDVVELTLTGAP